MPHRPTLSATAAILLFAGLASQTASAQDENSPPKGFVALFNGKDLAGWTAMPHIDPRKLAEMSADARQKKNAEDFTEAKKHWTVVDGDLVNDGHGAYLTTAKEYGDIELLIDYKTVAQADSGIYLRGSPQVQIWDFTEAGGKWKLGADKGSGALWNNRAGAPGKDPLVLADKPFGEWNRLRIEQVGARTSVHLNGKLVVDHAIMENFWDRDLPLFAKGVIQLQTHGGEIRWKNVFLREIPADEANAYLASKNDDSFKAIFDGKTLEGWAGAVANYEVKDGVIVCKPDSGGVLYSNKQFGDFVARVEFKLPPGGNNGLAIRYAGEGDAAYGGMTEIQVLDDTSTKYDKIDKRQRNGSAYGMVPSKTGFLRPVGAWNFEEVTVKGSKIRVELNGNVILDADLAQVHDFMANSPHPGKDKTTGYFGFAGHGDPVEFREVKIKTLD